MRSTLPSNFTASARVSSSRTPSSTSAAQPSLALSLAGDRVTPTLLHILPQRFADLLATLQFDGRYDMTLPAVKTGGNAFQAAGTLKLQDASARIGIGIDGLAAQID